MHPLSDDECEQQQPSSGGCGLLLATASSYRLDDVGVSPASRENPTPPPWLAITRRCVVRTAPETMRNEPCRGIGLFPPPSFLSSTHLDSGGFSGRDFSFREVNRRAGYFSQPNAHVRATKYACRFSSDGASMNVRHERSKATGKKRRRFTEHSCPAEAARLFHGIARERRI